MSVMEHLGELRRRLIVSAVAIAVGAVLAFVLYDRIFTFLIQPYCDTLPARTACRLQALDPLEGFATRLKVATWGGFLLASPVVFFQFWRFVTPGLNPNEKKYAVPFVTSAVVLFSMGVVLARLTFPKALEFLQGVGGEDLVNNYRPSSYLRLVILVAVAFGVAFLFPIVLMFLQLVGVLTSRQLAGWRRQAVVVIFVIGAVITPSQDPYSLFAMAIPMYIFYEASIILGRILKR